MNQRCVLFFLLVTTLLCSRAVGDIAPAPSDPGISAAAQSDNNSTSHQQEISDTIATEAKKLCDHWSEPATVNMVRQWFIAQLPVDPTGTATTPAYRDAYTKALNQKFVELLSKADTPPVVRLNIGIITEALPGNINMTPTVIQLLKDPAAVVAMWGEKAAKNVLVAGLQSNGLAPADRDQLLDTMVQAVIDHTDAPAIDASLADAAYRTLDARNSFPQNVFPSGASLQALIVFNLKLQKERLALYLKGVPPDPAGDPWASLFLFDATTVWPAMNADQQLQAVQQASDLISLLGQWGAASPLNIEELITSIHDEATWLENLNSFDLKLPRDSDLYRACLRAYGLSAASPAADIQGACDDVTTALKAIFSQVKDPPTITKPGATPASGPASAPAMK